MRADINMKLAMMPKEKNLIFSTFSAHTKMTAQKRGKTRCLTVWLPFPVMGGKHGIVLPTFYILPDMYSKIPLFHELIIQ